jgi:hypothetical protein
MAVGVVVSIVLISGVRLTWFRFVAVAGLFTFLAPLVAWLILRLSTTMVIFWWVARGSTLRVYLTRKIVGFEAAFMLPVIIVASVYGVTLLRNGLWISRWLGSDKIQQVLGMPIEAALVVFGIAIVFGVLFWRITIAIRALRWSNF